MYIYVQIDWCTYICTHVHTHTYIHICIHTYAYIHCTHSRTRVSKRTYTNVHTRAHMHTICTRTHTHIHTHRHTRIMSAKFSVNGAASSHVTDEWWCNEKKSLSLSVIIPARQFAGFEEGHQDRIWKSHPKWGNGFCRWFWSWPSVCRWVEWR